MAEFCIGTAQFGMQYGIANKTGKPSKKDIKKIIKYSIDSGICYFDTAQSYGDSEIALGKTFKDFDDSINLNVVTKLSPNLNFSDLDSVINSVNQSIKNLNTNILYGFLAHRFESITNKSFDNSMQVLKDKKLIKYSGVSVYNPKEALYALDSDSIDIIQIPFNIFDKRWLELDFFNKAYKLQKKIFLRSIFLQGLTLLSCKDLEKKNMKWAIKFLEEFNTLVSKTPYTIKELTFMAIKHLPVDVCVIMGVDKLTQLKENISIWKSVKLDDKYVKLWWKNLPFFPEKILNPSLW